MPRATACVCLTMSCPPRRTSLLSLKKLPRGVERGGTYLERHSGGRIEAVDALRHLLDEHKQNVDATGAANRARRGVVIGTGADQLLVQPEFLCDRICDGGHFGLSCDVCLWSRVCV